MVKQLGIIGVGNRLRSLVQTLESIDDGSMFSYVVYDPDPHSRECFIKHVGSSRVSFVSSVKEVLSQESVSWVLIGSPNHLHADVIIQAFSAGKHVFCEKPLATTVAACRNILETSASAPACSFMISYPLRYSQFYRTIKMLLDSRNLGRVISLEFNETIPFLHGSLIMSDWRRFESLSGGHLLEKNCHDIDIVNWLLDSRPACVASFGGLDFFVSSSSSVYDALPSSMRVSEQNPFLIDKTIVDNQVAIIEYENGVRATFHTNLNASIPERRLYICCSHGTIRADFDSGTIETRHLFDTSLNTTQTLGSVLGGHGGGDSLLMTRFKSILDTSFVHSDLPSAVCSTVSALLIDKSRRERRVVDASEVWHYLPLSSSSGR